MRIASSRSPIRYCIWPSSARACASFGVERQRALELVARVGVAPLERRRHAGAEMQPRVLRIGGERVAEPFGGGVRLAGVERRPRGALDQRAARIDLRAEAPRPSRTGANGSSRTAFIGLDHDAIVSIK